LLEKYSYSIHVKNYLQNTLYSLKTSWAKAYTNKIFIVGIQSTLHIESYNSAIKRFIFNSNTNLLELAEVSQELFPDIDELLIRFLSPTILKIQ
ncbi:28617_t:CDS:2, partial [Gigaspora margarita]